MASAKVCLLLISIFAALVAFTLTILPQYWTSDKDTTYCYYGVTTLADNRLKANCFTVSKVGTFVKVFLADRKDWAPEFQRKKGYVIPGLWDGHGHLLQYGELLQSVNLFGVRSLEEAVSRVKDYAKKNPVTGTEKEWIRGTGWDQAAFGRFPIAVSCLFTSAFILTHIHGPREETDKEELRTVVQEVGTNLSKADLEADPRLKGKYIMLDRVDVHCIWVSASVLELLPKDIPQVPGGEIIIDPGPGVFCDNAMDLVMQLWPAPSTRKKVQFVKAAMKERYSDEFEALRRDGR